MGSFIDQEGQEGIKKFLLKNSNVFSWSTVDMPGIFSTIIMHALNVSLEARLVRQKKRKLAPNRIQVAREETKKLLKARFIKKV